MQTRLGNTNTVVTSIGLGAMPLSLEGRPDEDTAIKVIASFIDKGGNFIDTANVYCFDDTDIGHNEQLINRALTRLGKKNDVIVATKGGLRRPRGSWDVDASPEWIRSSCEKSLQDLQVDSIFLYQLHAPDPNIPFTDSTGELLKLKEEGKIQHIGISNVNVDEINEVLSVTPVLSVQNRCNVFEKKSFLNGVVEKCHQQGIVFIPHSPVGGHHGHKNASRSDLLKRLAVKHECSTYQIMLAWLLRKGEFILPIPGASKVSSITDSMKSMNVTLDREDMSLLDDIQSAYIPGP